MAKCPVTSVESGLQEVTSQALQPKLPSAEKGARGISQDHTLAKNLKTIINNTFLSKTANTAVMGSANHAALAKTVFSPVQ